MKNILIAGPCSAESKLQVLSIAKELKDSNLTAFRAGIWKPRTKPGFFEGVGEKGLDWLIEVKLRYNIPVITEVALPYHVDLVQKKGIDMIWIGARTTVNPFMINELASSLRGIDIPVFIKNPINSELNLWIGAIERLQKVGIKDIYVIHRGFTGNHIKYRNDPMWEIPIELKRQMPELKWVLDPSHLAGDKKYIKEIVKIGLAMGIDGLMIEVHNDPENALSDSKQQITPKEFLNFMNDIVFYNTSNGSDQEIHNLRCVIDNVDMDMLGLLKKRMKIIKKIIKVKKDLNLSAYQSNRWNELLENRIKTGISYGLNKEFINEFYTLIHSESIKIQIKKFTK
jgi:chorismate mutase